MMVSPGQMLSTAAAVLIGGATGFVVLPKPTPPPPVEIVSIEYDYAADLIIYTRNVNLPEKVRGNWVGSVVDVATERALAGCEAHGSADYGPEEPDVQTFTADEFSVEGCRAAMVPGATYEWVGTVTTPYGRPSQKRSKPFTVPGG